MKKGFNKQDFFRIAAAVGAMVLLLGVFWLTSQTQRGYDGNDRGTFTVPEGNKKITLISSGKTRWDYLDQGQEALVESENQMRWKDNKFDSSNWKDAVGSFGAKEGELKEMGKGNAPNNLLVQYNEEGDSCPVYLFRTQLVIANPDSIKTLKGRVEFDDAVLIYINGELVWSGNNPDGGYENLMDYGAKEGISSPRTEEFIVKDTSVLKTGKNVVSVELHQNYKSGSDIYFDFDYLEGLSEEAGNSTLDTSGLILQVGEDEHSVVINWYTEEKGAFEFQYSIKQNQKEPGAYTSSLMGRQKAGKGVYCYTAVLSSLKAGNEYVYHIKRLGSGDISENYTYCVPEEGERFTFLFAGDPQIGAGEEKEDSVKWEETLEQGLVLAPEAEFLITAGDQTDSNHED